MPETAPSGGERRPAASRPERLCKPEVTGSIPVRSTPLHKRVAGESGHVKAAMACPTSAPNASAVLLKHGWNPTGEAAHVPGEVGEVLYFLICPAVRPDPSRQ